MSEPQVSVVVPCYNYGRFLPDCLASIFGQQGFTGEIEVLAIDDASTDDTAEILTRWATSEPRLRVCRHATNQGHLVTVNEGLAAARGRFVARIDPDDRYRPNFLAALLPVLEQHPHVGLAFGDAATIDAAGTVTCPCAPRPHGGRPFCGWGLLDILRNNYICAPATLGRREAWQRHLPIWPGMAFNDWYFNVLIARDYELAYVPDVVADYRVHGTNHHSRIVLNRTEEPSMRRVLDWVYAHPEENAKAERAKQAAKAAIYAGHFLDWAEKYFGVGYDTDAWRCYREAFRRKPTLLFRPGPLRRALGLLLGRSRYESVKRLFRRSPPAPVSEG
jgi:glycosyltransferase involved in cell wall biosynthesis